MIYNFWWNFNLFDEKIIFFSNNLMKTIYGHIWTHLSTELSSINFDKESFIQAIESFLLKKPLLKNNQVNLDKDQEICEPSKKKIKLLNFMNVYSDLCPSAENESKTILKQLDDYLLLVNRPGDINTRDFWLHYQSEWPELAAYTKQLLSVPATSAPVERIFSVGGAILRPARRRLSDKNFEMLMFLKCNLHLFKN